MKKITNKVRFLDSKDKRYVSRKLKDACQKVIDEYNIDETIVSPILSAGKYPRGDWDTPAREDMVDFKKVDLLEYCDESGKLNFNKLFKEFMAFISKKVEVEETTEEIKDNSLGDAEEEEDDITEDAPEEEEDDITEDAPDEDDIDEALEDLEEEENEGDETYEEYLRRELSEIEGSDKSNFRIPLIKILLKQNKGWGYLKEPLDLRGNEFDIVTSSNAKKVVKSFRESSKK